MQPDRNNSPGQPPQPIPRLHLPSQINPGPAGSARPGKASKTGHKRHRLRYIIIGLLILCIIIATYAGLTFEHDITQPVNRLDGSVTLVTITKGEGITEIGHQLAAKHLIRNANAFMIYAKFGPAGGQLSTGTYAFKPSQTIIRMVGMMHAGEIATVSVPIVEGLNLTKTAHAVAVSSFASATSFTDALDQTYTNAILSTRPAGTTSLEGLLAPGIYDMMINQTSHDLVAKMLDHFDQTTAKYRALTAPQGLTFYQAVTLASLVELEAGNTTDRKMIAGVFLNRLRLGMKLQTDTSLIYITGRTTVTAADTAIVSPYNTYLIAGLPPTPIDSPSLDAIDAVYHYTPSNYLYFVGGNDGKVHYAVTYAQHQANIAQYLP